MQIAVNVLRVKFGQSPLCARPTAHVVGVFSDNTRGTIKEHAVIHATERFELLLVNTPPFPIEAVIGVKNTKRQIFLQLPLTLIISPGVLETVGLF